MEKDNATWFFRDARKSESWWSCFFSLAVLSLAKVPDNHKIPLRRYVSKPKWEYPVIRVIDCQKFSFGSVLVEQKLKPEDFNIPKSEWPNTFPEPDVVLIDRDEKRVQIIENKTIGASLRTQLKRYKDLEKYLRANAWRAEVVLLLSVGYEERHEWKYIDEQKFSVILWEDVLRMIDQIPQLRSFFIGEELKQFYQAPLEQSN